MNIVLTVYKGFIGNHLVDSLLNEDIDVMVLYNFSTGRPEILEHGRNQIELV